jgi:hypothetical protein
MDKTAFEGAKDKLRLLLDKLKAMEEASDIQKLSDGWLDFLNETQRVFLKMKKATEKCSAKGWYDQIQNQRTSDDMLSYVLHARNADEHGISKVTEVERGGIGINVGGDGYVEHMEIRNTESRVDIKYRGKNPLHFNFIPGSVKLLPVFDRGIKYDVPKKHMGKPIEAKPLAVAKLTAEFLKNLMEEAEKKFPPR